MCCTALSYIIINYTTQYYAILYYTILYYPIFSLSDVMLHCIVIYWQIKRSLLNPNNIHSFNIWEVVVLRTIFFAKNYYCLLVSRGWKPKTKFSNIEKMNIIWIKETSFYLSIYDNAVQHNIWYCMTMADTAIQCSAA